jgi:hypothetical protein
VGAPKLGLTALSNPAKDVMAIADAMFAKGWVSSRTGTPPAIHLMLSPAHVAFAEAYLADLAVATAGAGAATGGKAKGEYA